MGSENRLEYEETELRLGLPGGSSVLKRGFAQTIDLKLNLTASSSSSSSSHHHNINCNENNGEAHHHKTDDEKNTKPPTK